MAPKSKASKPQPLAPETEEEPTTRPTRRWTKDEDRQILTYLLSIIQEGKSLEKPTAKVFYQKALESLCFENCSINQLKHHVKNLRNKYTMAIQWRDQTGQGVLQEQGEQKLKGMTQFNSRNNFILKMVHYIELLEQRCPLFSELDEIFGEKTSIVPPYLHESSTNTQDHSQIIEVESVVPSGTVNLASCVTEVEDEDVTIMTDDNAVPRAPSKEKPIPKKRRIQQNAGITALARTAELRFEIQKEELELAKVKWEDEKLHRSLMYEIEVQKLEHEKALAEKRIRLEEKKLQNDFEIAKFKIEQEFKLQIELSKLKDNQ